MCTEIDRISKLAKEDPTRRFFSIAHLITPQAMYTAFRGLRKKASAGVDGVTYAEYAKDVAGNIRKLHLGASDRAHAAVIGLKRGIIES